MAFEASHEPKLFCDDDEDVFPLSAILPQKISCLRKCSNEAVRKRPPLDENSSIHNSVKKPKLENDDDDEDVLNFGGFLNMKRKPANKSFSMFKIKKFMTEQLALIEKSFEEFHRKEKVEQKRLQFLKRDISKCSRELAKKKMQIRYVNQVQEKFEGQVREHELKVKRFEEQVKELESRKKKLEEGMKEFESKKKVFEGLVKEFESKEREFQGQIEELDSEKMCFESRVKEFESIEKQLDSRMKEFESDFVQNLIREEQHIAAVRFICAYDLIDKYQPFNLLREHMEKAKLISESRCKKTNSIEIKDEARDEEIACLKTVLDCISDNNLKSECLLNKIQFRIFELIKRKGK